MPSEARRSYVVVEGHGEVDAVLNLLTRLRDDLGLSALPPFAPPARLVGSVREDVLTRYAERIRLQRDAAALLFLADDDDGCPKEDGPRLARHFASLALPFPVAVTLAYREYESLFLASLPSIAGKEMTGPGGPRAGIVAGATFDKAPDAVRGVKEWLTGNMPKGRAYKPSVDQLPLTRMVDFGVVRTANLPWFGTLERSLRFLATNLGAKGIGYPQER